MNDLKIEEKLLKKKLELNKLQQEIRILEQQLTNYDEIG